MSAARAAAIRAGAEPVSSARAFSATAWNSAASTVTSSSGHKSDAGPGQDDRVLAERAARVVGRLVQPGCGVVHRHVRPQSVDDPLAVQLPARCQREHLDQRGRAAAAPLLGRHRLRRRR